MTRNTSDFFSLISSNFPKCPGCNRDYITESSPVSMVDGKTKVCETCSAGEATRSSIANVDASSLLNNSGTTEDLADSYSVARGFERSQDKAQSDSYFHNQRVRNSSVPIPEPTKTGKWNVEYSKNQHTGEIEAHADNGGLSHYAHLDHETGSVRYGAYGTNVPPSYVQKHISSVLTRHWRKHIQGNQ